MTLELFSLSKTLGQFHLRDVTMKVEDCEYFMVLGPSGAGKTILLETIAGIHTPDHGRIVLDGNDITHVPARHRNIGMVYQDYMLFPHLSVEKNIGFGLKQKKVSSDDIQTRVHEMSHLLGIFHLLDRMPGTLSGGEQQRVAIARALIIRPRLLLLDEPLSALDAVTRRKIRLELGRLPSLIGISVIHITHHAEDLMALGNRSAVMDEGRIIQSGVPDEIFSNPQTPFVAAFTGLENFFQGVAVSKPDGKIIKAGNARILAVTPLSGQVLFGIRAEDIIFSKKPLDSSARNVLKGTVVRIRLMGSCAWVQADCGLTITGVVTVQSLYSMNIEDGDEIYVTFKASAVMVFPADDILCERYFEKKGLSFYGFNQT